MLTPVLSPKAAALSNAFPLVRHGVRMLLLLTVGVFVLCCPLVQFAEAWNISAPLNVYNVINSQSVYIYNPASQTIVNPVTSSGNQLTMVPWLQFTPEMQWNISTNDPGVIGYSIYAAVSNAVAGCTTVARWSARETQGGGVVSTRCSAQGSTLINGFAFEGQGTYCIVGVDVPTPLNSYCVQIVNNQPNLAIHGGCPNQIIPTAQWQLVTIY